MTSGGFNETMDINLAADRTYSLDHKLISCVIGPLGEMPITFSREEGAWKMADGIIVLEPRARTEGFPDAPVFVPSLARRLAPKRKNGRTLLVSADYPQHLVLVKKAPSSQGDTLGGASKR